MIRLMTTLITTKETILSDVILDAQYIVETYTRNIEQGDKRKVIGITDPGCHLLVIPNNDVCTVYHIRYGGADCPTTSDIRGYAIPLLLNYDIPLRESNDHLCGCSKLNYESHPKLVIDYADGLDTIFRYSDPDKQLYVDQGLKFQVDRQRIEYLYEGLLPIKVKGSSVCGPSFDDWTSAWIVTGNCM